MDSARRCMQIREARIDDAIEMCHVLRRSIVELCRADHQDDPSALEEWLRNKTPDQARSWMANPESYIFVATDDSAIIGVGAVSSSGQILLNYVSPDARFRGVSKAILNQPGVESSGARASCMCCHQHRDGSALLSICRI